MFERPLALVTPLVSGQRALDAVREISAHHRIQSTPGYSEAARWLESQLRATGLEVEVEHVSGDGRNAPLGCVLPMGWVCERGVASLQGEDGREPLADFAAEPLSLVQRSTPAFGCFDIVALADGTRPEHYDGVDVRGRVVLTDGAVQRVHQLAVLERGAAGILCDGRRLVPPARTRDHDRDSLAYTSFWWGASEASGWGFVLTPDRGEELRSRLATGERVQLEAEIVSRFAPADIALVSATLPGDLPGEVLVTAHLCHYRPGANDNASGVAAALESARALAALRDAGALPAGRRTVRWLWMPEFTGTYAWMERRPECFLTVAAINLDMVGEDQAQCASEQQLERAPHFAASFAEELLSALRPAAWTEAEPLAVREVRYSGGSDHSLWLDPAVGVPCPMLIQWPDRFYHSNFDTIERCDPRSLAHAARCAAAYALAVASPGAEPVAWLLGAVERATRRKLRAALESPDPVRAVRAARFSGQVALASVSRFVQGLAAEHAAVVALRAGVPECMDGMEGHYDSEIAPALPADAPPAAARAGRVPVRIQRSLLAPMRLHQQGYASLRAAERERLVALDRDVAGGSGALDVAWFACDGERTLFEIAELVRDEGHEVSDGHVSEFFELAAAMGASAWR
ncbi:MAG: DUF4910 domain-containing protein [Candidatus Eisenbacteria bacterium]|nr:DUF4910 domain-containing protein [Candidatus Eisenbacteria bacterium]